MTSLKARSRTRWCDFGITTQKLVARDPIPLNDPIRANATENIKRCWIEQGIWDDINWNDGVGFSWKHERRLEFEVEYEPDAEWEPPLGSPSHTSHKPTPQHI
jgi:hypothetical protein